jgi:hypothetical protein
MDVRALATDGINIYAGTFGSGIWKRSISEITNNDWKNENNYEFSVYPNPTDKILYISTKEKATIEIINIRGQILDIKNLTENSYSIDISNLVSGVYTLRIKTDKGIAIRKLIKK